MALIDIAPLTLAVDRSLFGPQGRGWIERKVPEIVSNLMFVGITGIGACILIFAICVDYHKNDFLHALLNFPKHIANGFMIYMVIRVMRWHISELIHKSFMSDDLPNMITNWAVAAAAATKGYSKNNFYMNELGKAKQMWPWAEDDDREFTLPTQSEDVRTSHSSSEELSDENNNIDSEIAEPPSIVASLSEIGTEQMKLSASVESGGNNSNADEYRCSKEQTSSGLQVNPDTSIKKIISDNSSSAVKTCHKAPPISPLTRTLRSRRNRDRRGKTSKLQPFFFTRETAMNITNSLFFMRLVEEDGWMFVEDQLYDLKDGGLGWLQNLFYKGYKVGIRRSGEVSPHEAHRMLFQCEQGRSPGHIRLRSCSTNTFLFMIGIQKPTLVAWDRDVMGGHWEDIKIEWLNSEADKGKVLIFIKKSNGYLMWTGQKFTHTAEPDSASRFMLQGIH